MMSFLVFFTLASCDKREVKTYIQGDQVTLDGVIYTYYDEENLYSKEIPFVQEKEHKSYYNYYYYDMSELDNKQPISTYDGGLIHYLDGNEIYGKKEFYAEAFHYFLKNCDLAFSPSTAEFYRIKDYFSPSFISNGFIVTGYTSDLGKNVIIPEKVNDIRVIQIGYKAFENAPMETFSFLTTDEYNKPHQPYYELVHPFAFSNCPNLIEIQTYARVLSMGISNCPKLEKVSYITPTSDCTLYNLPSLTSLKDIDARAIESRSFKTVDRICFYQTRGFRKSSIYLCPKLQEITGIRLSQRGNVIYDYYVPFYAFDNYSIMLRDMYFVVKGYERAYTITYNPETLEMYLPCLNTGLNYTGELYKDPTSSSIEEKEDAFYVEVSYPKIIEGVTDWPTEFCSPIQLKIPKISK